MNEVLEKFRGTGVAIVTPFNDDFSIDYNAIKKLVEYVIDGGVDYIVVQGTTGESSTLTQDEKIKSRRAFIDANKERLPLVVGIGSNDTESLINYIKNSDLKGFSAVLSVTPYYNKPTQEGLYQHYKAINDKCGIPILIYNIPGRSVIDMSVDTMARLFELKNIVGVKDATGDLNRVDLQLSKMGNEFVQLTGNDDNAFEFNRRGGVGSISVTANIAPKICSDFQKFSISKNENDHNEAKKLDNILQTVHNAMFVESNPSPVKYAAKLMNLCDDAVRLPLVKVTEETKSIVKKALVSAKLI